MARVIDPAKLERIKEAVIEMIVEKGYGGASISAISRRAGVAEGYLYRYYKGKEELVNELLYQLINVIADEFEVLLDQYENIDQVVEKLVKRLFLIAEEKPSHIKFIYVLMHDYNFSVAEEQRVRIQNLCERIKIIGRRTHQIGDRHTEEEIYLMLVAYPIQLINHRMKGFFGRSGWDSQDLDNVIVFCKNALKE